MSKNNTRSWRNLPDWRELKAATGVDIHEFTRLYGPELNLCYRMARDFMLDHPPETFTVLRHIFVTDILSGRMLYDRSTKKLFATETAPKTTLPKIISRYVEDERNEDRRGTSTS